MHLVNVAKFLNVTSFYLLFEGVAVPLLSTVVVPLTSMYASLWSHKLQFNNEVLNLIWLAVLCVPS